MVKLKLLFPFNVNFDLKFTANGEHQNYIFARGYREKKIENNNGPISLGPNDEKIHPTTLALQGRDKDTSRGQENRIYEEPEINHHLGG
ncbi:hypothetical protein GWI33_004902 [Rhynchophorus ferrugineus]|uniref:Uncharacterized protein n=1 Tax=Rhynchophorus ferrugineus TaxID=354439 RepID=A0A834MGF1_RHYFE|nr:hypothetical protein GWI33_004902 [Rhynchophorus ferrugineus]